MAWNSFGFRTGETGRNATGKSASAWSFSSSPWMRLTSASASCWVWMPPQDRQLVLLRRRGISNVRTGLTTRGLRAGGMGTSPSPEAALSDDHVAPTMAAALNAMPVALRKSRRETPPGSHRSPPQQQCRWDWSVPPRS